jgi:hypothetical protein
MITLRHRAFLFYYQSNAPGLWNLTPLKGIMLFNVLCPCIMPGRGFYVSSCQYYIDISNNNFGTPGIMLFVVYCTYSNTGGGS